jgi:hypothetical protein
MSEWLLFNIKWTFSPLYQREQVTFLWDGDDDIHFVLDQHALLDSRTRPTARKCCDSKKFWVICDDFFFLVTGNRDQKFLYCSRIYVRNWFTFLNEQNPLLDFEGTRFVNELWKKKKSPYLLTHRWNEGLGAGNKHIFKGGLSSLKRHFWKLILINFHTAYKFLEIWSINLSYITKCARIPFCSWTKSLHSGTT